MGAGQVGGIASLLDIDLENAAGFAGKQAEGDEALFIVYFLSHALIFCTGALIEAHIVLTPAICVTGESKQFAVIGGTHRFIENTGVTRTVEHICNHRAFNRTNLMAGGKCPTENMALLVLSEQFHFHRKEPGAEYILNRVRYGTPRDNVGLDMKNCQFYGWGSRRNDVLVVTSALDDMEGKVAGYLVPLLINLRRVDVTILSKDSCAEMWSDDGAHLCIAQFPCQNRKIGALCPDDMGSVVVCSGFIKGMMASRIVDRPCGVGFLDMNKFLKFVTCGVDGARDMSEDSTVSDPELAATVPSTTAADLGPAEPAPDDQDIGPEDVRK